MLQSLALQLILVSLLLKVLLNSLAVVHGLLEGAINLGAVIVTSGPDLFLAIFDQLNLPPVGLH